jgi:transcriptional regulator with XRE-family HTH domain
MSEEKVLSILNKYYLGARERNPSFSLRALAKKLEISPSYLTLLINGKRRLSKINAEKILKGLGVKKYRRLELIADLEASQKRSTDLLIEKEIGDSRYKNPLSDNYDYKLLADWFAITHSLIGSDGFIDDPKWVYERVGIIPKDYEAVKSYMLDSGHIKYNSLGKLVTVGKEFFLPIEGVEQRMMMSDSYIETLKRAVEGAKRIKEGGYKTPGTGYSLTANFDPSQFEDFKRHLKIWTADFSARNEKKKLKKTEVYTLSIELFPVSFEVEKINSKYERSKSEYDKKLASGFIDRKKYDQFLEKCEDLGIEAEKEIEKWIEKGIEKVMKKEKK